LSVAIKGKVQGSRSYDNVYNYQMKQKVAISQSSFNVSQVDAKFL